MICTLYIIFSKSCVVQLIVLKINFFYQRDIRKVKSNFISCQEIEKCQWLIISMWQLVEISWEIAVYAVGNVSNFLKSQGVSKEILSDLVRKDVAKFSEKFYYFQCSTLEMFKGTFSNYSVLKLFFHQHSDFCHVL